MVKCLNKNEIETIILQTVLARPYAEFDGCRVYPLNASGEEQVIKNLAGTKEVTTLMELEEAINTPDVAQVYISKYAAITAKGLKSVLSRTSLTKEIFCAFEIKN
ncbi:MAG: hypothetical protein NC218_10725 [Acetobacter sp.]|nr:hypothetical protein [Acetobacter sp.]